MDALRGDFGTFGSILRARTRKTSMSGGLPGTEAFRQTDDLVTGNPHMTGDLVAGNMSKVDPTHLTKLDQRSTILLQATRKLTELQEGPTAGWEE